MSEKDIKTDKVVEAEACAWIAQLESGNLSDQDRAALECWLARSPQHRAALRHYARQWQMADSLAALREPMEGIIAERHRARRGIGGGFLARAGRYGAYAASFAAVTIMAMTTILFLPPAGGHTEQMSIATAIGQSRQMVLSDGSVVTANTNSHVRIDYDEDFRHAYLLKGEAIFTVAKDADRPFIVHAGHQTVRAVGTEFAVRIGDNDTVTVAVTEGRVELAKEMPRPLDAAADSVAPAAPSVMLAKGYEATARAGGLEVMETADSGRMEQRLSWRTGVLDFSGETLDYAISEIMRYSKYDISIQDPQLRDMRIGGVFQMSDIDELFAILEESFGITVVHGPGNVILLSRDDTDTDPAAQ